MDGLGRVEEKHLSLVAELRNSLHIDVIRHCQ